MFAIMSTFIWYQNTYSVERIAKNGRNVRRIPISSFLGNLDGKIGKQRFQGDTKNHIKNAPPMLRADKVCIF